MPLTPDEVALVRRELGPDVRSIPASVLGMLYEKRLFKLFVPDHLSGRMTPLPEALKIFSGCARIDGNLGWAVCIGSGGGYFADGFSEEVAHELFAPVDAVVAGSGAPANGRWLGDEVELSGRWSWCSGAGYATVFTGGVDLDNEVAACAMRPDQVTVIPDWDGFGLRATESHTVGCSSARVPRERVFRVGQSRWRRPEPIYRYPFTAFARQSFAAVVLGLGQALLDEVACLLEEGRISGDLRRTHIGKCLAEARGRLARAEADLETTAADCWRQHLLGGLAQCHLDGVSRITQSLSETAADLTASLAPHMGMAMVLEHSALNYIFRNLMTANQHTLLKPWTVDMG